MRTISSPHMIINNSQGMISVDFIFSLILCAGLCMVMFALTFTLSMAEIAQYITFSTSRAYVAGHIDPDKQNEMGQNKFKSLMSNGTLSPLFTTSDAGWFKLSNLELRGGGASGQDFSKDYPYEDGRIPQTGARLTFSARVLALRIAFLGRTTKDGEAPQAKLTAFLIREPTQQECWELQVKKRYEAIVNLDSRFGVLADRYRDKYKPMEDNGC
ncbi:hypothetical protein [Bdellovibrio sp. HCB274]|uniref:hypothetical protein n=1 Tax=Bdellovibrio sp. HCB274 TaxID=3394361 RepID=UPI0039B3BC30